MDIQAKIKLTEENIRQALADYRRHTSATVILDNVSDKFIQRLAKDSVQRKMELRKLFRKSPVWNETLDALVINGTRTHDPDYSRICLLAEQILINAIIDHREKQSLIEDAIRFFCQPHASPDYQEKYISAINTLAPKAYALNKRPSRVFKSLCDALGVSNNIAGSKFQRLYAQFADELSAKKIDFQRYVSINPAHFLTMSNPKYDKRRGTLTSCHSFNDDDHAYNCGCSGYARDNYTFIVFTASNPDNPETLNNRKTTRQIFAYKPGNGLLLQSRLYNTSGGTYGAQEESKVYRDLIQRELSALEDAPNLWRTFKYCDNKSVTLPADSGFGGYLDWLYANFDAMISIRADHKAFAIGTWGLCIRCGKKTNAGLYCENCSENKYYFCDYCNHSVNDIEDLYTVYDEHDHERYVCEYCMSHHYTMCDECEEYYPNESVISVGEDDYLCPNCFERYGDRCSDCGKPFRIVNLFFAIHGQVRNVNHEAVSICPAYKSDLYIDCRNCGEIWHIKTMEDGICPECKTKNKKNKEKTA